MLLNEAERLWVLHGLMLRVMESALTELRWSTFESWVWLSGDRIFEARFWAKAEQKEESSRTGQEEEDSKAKQEEEGSKAERRKRARPPRGRPPLRTMIERYLTTLIQGGKLWERDQFALSVMAFPRLPDAREMANFVRRSFRWHWRGAIRPPRPLPDDYQDLCPRFVISEASRLRATSDYPKCTEQASEYVLDNFCCSLRDPSAPGPRSLPPDYDGLCPCFDLGVATRYAHNSNIPEMVQRAQASRPANPPAGPALLGGPTGGWTTSFPTFRNTTHVAEYVRDNLRWSLRESSSIRPNLLPLHFERLCPEFDHIMAMQFAHAARIPEMVQAIFYAMVISDAAELRLSSRDAMGDMMLELQELRWNIMEA
ncbi:hypothetical protein Cgig2_015312 [Carnegiea gigantea]|uniref:Uncharacterized protein n=1 Tax=Carnegiea gigantea TaxID=171969 RepID=A0A9Q1JR92_9CARY|nr:hypothetical protein Cgig2_015312 [Carnegiea gigantea]